MKFRISALLIFVALSWFRIISAGVLLLTICRTISAGGVSSTISRTISAGGAPTTICILNHNMPDHKCRNINTHYMDERCTRLNVLHRKRLQTAFPDIAIPTMLLRILTHGEREPISIQQLQTRPRKTGLYNGFMSSLKFSKVLHEKIYLLEVEVIGIRRGEIQIREQNFCQSNREIKYSCLFTSKPWQQIPKTLTLQGKFPKSLLHIKWYKPCLLRHFSLSYLARALSFLFI